LLLLPRVSLRAIVPFLATFALSPHQTLFGEKSSLALQLDVVLQVLLVLSSKPRWIVRFPPVLIEGELQLHLLGGGVGLAHLPIIVLSMAGAQWRLHSWTEEPVVPLRARPQFYHTFPPASLLVSL
jgi:hypothetical protein